MRAHQPAFNQRGHAVHARQNFVSLFARAFDGRSVVDVIVFRGTRIRIQPVRVNSGTGQYMFLNKFLKCFGIRIGNNLQAAAPKAFWREQFHGDGDHHLAVGTTPAFTVPDAAKDSFVHLDMPGQHIVPGMANSAPETVQHCPCCLIGAKSKDSMRRFGRNAIFSEGDMPRSGKPNSQRCLGAMKEGASGRRDAVATCFAPPFAVLHAPTLAAVARWALKAVFPAKPVKIVDTGGVIREPRHKLGVVARVINSGFGRGLLFGGAC